MDCHGASERLMLPTVQEVKSRRRKRESANVQHEATLSPMERLALWITRHVGSMGFFVVILAWTALWMGWNVLAQRFHWGHVFDQPWQFLVWLFISNVLQIHLMPLIMVGQNLLGRHAEMRAAQEYETTVQVEYETEVMLRYLEVIYERLNEVQARLTALEQGGGQPA
ncbi:MAG: DUF1003 domain-containing protein [Armatimonadetes bacterium]|nr:DUF1003 domain-containing protein [Armatimonadota bacterium]